MICSFDQKIELPGGISHDFAFSLLLIKKSLTETFSYIFVIFENINVLLSSLSAVNGARSTPIIANSITFVNVQFHFNKTVTIT